MIIKNQDMRVENFENNTQLRAYFSATNIYYIYIYLYIHIFIWRALLHYLYLWDGSVACIASGIILLVTVISDKKTPKWMH